MHVDGGVKHITAVQRIVCEGTQVAMRCHAFMQYYLWYVYVLYDVPMLCLCHVGSHEDQQGLGYVYVRYVRCA